MTATLPLRPTHTNGRRRPVVIEVNQHELVGMCMDMETLATEALTAFGYALQSVCRLPADPMASEARDALKEVYPRLTRLLNEARIAAGRYDLRQPDA